MPYPVIRINVNTGSDTAASGAGPDPALTGFQASTDAAGTTVDLSLDNPDLSNVATDGTHVIWLSGTGGIEFSPIVGVDNVAKTVTVHSGYAFPANLSGLTWAIGGKRASLDGVASAMSNQNDREYWTFELETDVPMASGTLTLGKGNGAAVLVRSNVAGTKRRIYGALDAIWFSCAGHVTLTDLYFDRASAASRGGASVAVSASNRCTVVRCKAEKFVTGFDGNNSGGQQKFIACDAVDCTNGFSGGGSSSAGGIAFGCIARNCDYGFSSQGSNTTMTIAFCIAHNCAVYGMHVGGGYNGLILNCVINGSGSHGIDITGNQHPIAVVNCIISNNGGYAIKADGTNNQYEVSVVAVNTAFWNNTSGVSDMPNMILDGCWTTEDPQFADVANLDFSVQNQTLKDAGIPSGNFIGWGGTNTPLYLDIGAGQLASAIGKSILISNQRRRKIYY